MRRAKAIWEAIRLDFFKVILNGNILTFFIYFKSVSLNE